MKVGKKQKKGGRKTQRMKKLRKINKNKKNSIQRKEGRHIQKKEITKGRNK
jgi:hypothetical protein